MKKLLILAALAAATVAGAQTVKLDPVPSGFMPKMGGYRPQQLKLTDAKPASVTKLPTGITNAKFGVLTIGGRGYAVCIGDVAGKTRQLFVDTNGNGDLTDDPAPDWNPRPSNNLTMMIGHAKVGYNLMGSTEPVSLGVYQFDPTDSNRPQLKDVLLYYTDYGFTGEAKLNGKTYTVLLTDDMATGDFRNGRFMIDLNGDGKFDPRSETYPSNKPFNIGGTTYELAGLTASGGSLTFKVSATKVAEILPPVGLVVGKPFPGFKAKTMDSKNVNFPSSYKGHVVMLDFWATWCGPCIGEMPNVTAAYEKFHDSGFDILGVTLDKENAEEKIADFTKEKKMPWPQIYDGKWWSAEIAVKYGIQAIPASYLVDADTGILLAAGDSMRGEGLSKLVEDALTKKGLLKHPQK